MSLVTKLVELGMVPELAKLVGGSSGTFTATGTTPVVVADANLAAGDSVLITLGTVGGTVGAMPTIKTRTDGTGFTVAATASDTSIYNYRILKS